MDELREIANSYYNASSTEVQEKAQEFFGCMDIDGDGKVDLEEFLKFMKDEGYTDMHKNDFFKSLDSDGNGVLSFDEAITLYYIIKSARPFCDACGAFIPGIFFSCVHCFSRAKSSFNICHHCYKSNNCKHNHGGGRALFLDNYTLLQATRHSPTTTTITDQRAKTMSKDKDGQAQSPRRNNETTSKDGVGQSLRRTESKSKDGVGQSIRRTESKSIRRTESKSKDGRAQSIQTTPRQGGSASSTSRDFATDYMMNEFNRVLAQSGSTSSPTPKTAAKYVSAPSVPNTHRVNPSNAIVVATQRQIKKKERMSSASAAFKALETMIALGNAFAAVSGACTIM